MAIDERLVIDKEKYFELIGYKPHAKQMEFHRSDARFKVVVAGRRAGKTQMTAKDIEPLLMIPDKRVWLVGSTYALSEKEFRIIWQDMIIKLGFGKDPSLKKSYSLQQGNMFIEFPWGTRIECKSADRKDTLVGDGLDLVVMCEASKHTRDTWERFIQPALSDKRGSAIFSTCVAPGTMLATDDGIIEIGDLYQGQQDGTFIDYEKFVAGFHGPMEKSTKFYVNGTRDTIRVTNGLGSFIEGTYNHPIWAMRDGNAQWIQLQDLKIGDWTATRVGADVWGSEDDTDDFVKDLDHGNTIDFETKLTPKLAYLIGYIIGNGHIDFKHNKISVSTAEPIIGKFLETFGFKYYGGASNKYKWDLSRKVFVDFLRYLGFDDVKGPNKVIPKRLLRCSRQTLKYLISGLFDADGSADRNRNRVAFSSTSRKLVDQVQFILANFGIIGRITSSNRPPTEIVDVWSLVYTLELQGMYACKFHEIIGFELKRKQRKLKSKINRFYGIPTQNSRIVRLFNKYSKGKGSKGPNLTYNLDYLRTAEFASYEKFEHFLNILEPYAWDDADWQYLKNLCVERYYWTQVKNLTKSKSETYDLVIPTNHAFISNTFISHNTPHGQDWVYELWQLGNDDNEPEYRGWQYPSWDNTIIYPGGRKDSEILRMERTMSKDWFLQEIAADFTSFSGKIYSEFMEKTHVKNHTYRPDWPNYIGFDFGFVNPLAAIEFQVSPQDTIHIWREHYESGMTMEDHIRYMRNRDQPEGYKIDLTFGDAADPEAITYLCRHFAPCIGDPKSKDNWRAGIELVKRFLKIRDNGVPGLRVDPSCKHTIREFNNYKSSDTGKADNNPREDAKKNENHSMDAIRYSLVHIFELGMRVRLSDVIDINELTSGLGDGGRFTNAKGTSLFPGLETAGFVTLDGKTF